MDASFEGPEITNRQLKLKSRVDMPLAKLQANFRMNLVLAVICTALMAVLFYMSDGIWAQVLIGIIIIGYFVAIWQTTYLYNRYLKNLYPDNDVKSYLKTLHKSIKEGLKYQEMIAIFFYPVSLAAGYFFSLYEQGEADSFFTEPAIWGALILVILVMTPLLFLLSRWLYNITFRKYLDQIEGIINELEIENGYEN